MKTLTRLLTLFCLLACTLAYGQTDTLRYVVRGSVRDASGGKPLAYVSVTIPGTNYATVTNSDGTFVIKSDTAPRFVTFSLLGYKVLTAPADRERTMQISLTRGQFTLDPAQVISGDPLSILRDAIYKIADNCPNEPAFVTISNANGYMVSIPQVLMVTIPACLIGLMCAAAASYKRGKDLDKDPLFQQRKADPETYQYMYGSHATTLDKTITPEARASVFIFLGALLVIVLFAFCQMIHVQDGRSLAEALSLPKMNIIIQIIMLTAAACNIMFCKAKPKKAVGGAVWQSGMVAVVAIYGIAWLADTYFGNYLDQMKVMLADIVTKYPWSIAFVFFLVSVLINSQGAVVVAMLPLAYELGIAGPVLLGVLPSVYGYFFIPNYPSDIATVNFDRSGTSRLSS